MIKVLDPSRWSIPEGLRRRKPLEAENITPLCQSTEASIREANKQAEDWALKTRVSLHSWEVQKALRGLCEDKYGQSLSEDGTENWRFEPDGTVHLTLLRAKPKKTP